MSTHSNDYVAMPNQTALIVLLILLLQESMGLMRQYGGANYETLTKRRLSLFRHSTKIIINEERVILIHKVNYYKSTKCLPKYFDLS